MLITADVALLSESLYGFLVALALLAAVRCRDAPHWRRGAALGAVAGLPALTRSEGFLLLLLLLIPIARARRGVSPAGVALLTMLVLVAPLTVRTRSCSTVSCSLATISASRSPANCPVTYSGAGVGSWFPGAACTRAYPATRRRCRPGMRRTPALRRAPPRSTAIVLPAREARVCGLLQPGLADDGRNGSAKRLGMLT